MKPAHVTFLPSGQTVEATPGESLLDVALNHQVPMAHACGGFCACTTCHVYVQSGDEHLSKVEDDEEERLERAIGLKLNSRLGCQARILGGSVTVEVVNPED